MSKIDRAVAEKNGKNLRFQTPFLKNGQNREQSNISVNIPPNMVMLYIFEHARLQGVVQHSENAKKIDQTAILQNSAMPQISWKTWNFQQKRYSVTIVEPK